MSCFLKIVQILGENWLRSWEFVLDLLPFFYVESVAVLTMTWSYVRIAVIV